ncbi:extracellular solute-binding protein, partial [Ruminococcaceae bacterium OttesenSCG-928-L11]|nr:extracellular solute-binding protein [Ruminococcaceae bacterium OttesenSCG-928-L11]
MNTVKNRKALAAALALCLTLPLGLSACNGGGSGAATSSQSTASSVAASSAVSTAPASSTPAEQPKGDPVPLTIYKPLHTNLQQYASGNKDLPFYEELAKNTNTELTFMTPPVGQEKEQFNLIIASGDFPDLFIDPWTNYTGGAAKALQDNIIIPLNDLMESHGPNMKQAFADFPNAMKYVTTENGDIYGAPIIFASPLQLVTWGPNMRLDWLEELGMELPQTIEEYHAVLTAFKNEKGATCPMVFSLDHFKNSMIVASAYGVSTSEKFYQENGVVKYGPMEPGYRSYLETLSQWYSEGLIDPDFATLDNNTRNTKMLNGQSGLAYAPTKGGLAAWTSSLRETNPSATVGGAPFPALNKGETVAMGQTNDPATVRTAISSTCKTPEAAMAFIDYGYSEEGHMLLNFGIEGVSYEMIDGKAIYTDLIMKSEEMPPLSRLNHYATSPEGNAGLQMVYDIGFLEQMNAYEPQINIALERWSGSNTYANNIPGSVKPLSEDSSKYATIMNEVITYVDEMFLKFVMGQESLDKYDSFVETIKAKDIETAVAIMQRAYDS